MKELAPKVIDILKYQPARRYFVEAMEVSPHYKKVKGLNGKALKEYSDANPSYGNIVQIVNSFKELFRMEQNIHIKKANDRRNKKKTSRRAKAET